MLDRTSTAGATVLVVDDAPPNIKLLRLILKDAGYRVLEATNGPEALATLRREKPDAMVLDVRMPGMTGYDVCREIRHDSEFATLPVIMVTALSLPEERIKGIESGATDFITKPFNKRELLARLQLSLALAKSGKNAIVPQLPGAVVIADADWAILCMSPLASILLGISTNGIDGLDFTELLDQTAKDQILSNRPGEPFQLFNAANGSVVTARLTHVAGVDGKPLLRVIALSETPLPAAG